MRLIPLGAAGEVTGSAYYLIGKQGRLLIDCGMFQGGPDTEAKNASLPVKVDELDGVLVTHAHLDHTGRLPLLVKRGYAGPIYATEATVDLSGLVTADSARIQEWDAKEAKREGNGDAPVEPLYTEEDAAAAQRLFEGVPFDQPVEVLPGTRARWVEAGHLLGSASIELTVEEDGRRTVIVFSGDIGPTGKPLIRDAEPLHYADVVLLESTYGARDHRSARESAAEAVELINRTVERKGKVLVPAFALGRTQELIYAAVGLFRNNRVPEFPIYVDSPMAIEATEVFVKHPDLMDEETMALVESGELAEDLTVVHATRSAAESRELNDMPGPMMIIATSGMCTGGRILHHLLHNLARPETAVIFTGYQGEGTLGRQLVDGAEHVRIFGKTIPVRASICTVGGFSGHAGQSQLVEWFDSMASSRPRLLLVHGEDPSREALAGVIEGRYGIKAMLPRRGQAIEL